MPDHLYLLPFVAIRVSILPVALLDRDNDCALLFDQPYDVLVFLHVLGHETLSRVDNAFC